MTTAELNQLTGDVAAFAREEVAARTRVVPKPECLDSAFPETAEALAKFLPAPALTAEARRKAEAVIKQFRAVQDQKSAEYGAALLQKDNNLLSPSEKRFLEVETLKAVKAFQRGELE